MSHNVHLSGIVFSDLDILAKAFDELKAESPEAAQYEFIRERTAIRGWAGQTATVDAAIKCHGQRYDIGFRKNHDGHLVPFMEYGFSAPGLATQDGAKGVDGAACAYGHEHRALGMLRQRYATIQVEGKARQMGHNVRRTKAKDGQIQLEVIQR